MIQKLKNVIVFKIISLFILIFPIIFYLHVGASTDPYWKIAQSVIFTIVCVFSISIPKSRKIIFWLGFVLIITMAALYIFHLIDWADLVGSTGFGVIIINLISYIPQLVKLGYIKEL